MKRQNTDTNHWRSLRLMMLVGVVLLCACAKQWTKPGFSVEAWKVDKNECDRFAQDNFPPKYEPFFTTAPGINYGCTPAGKYIPCTPVYGPPQTVVNYDDVNATKRIEAAELCLRKRGYTTVD